MGAYVALTTDLEQSDLLTIAAESPFFSDAERVEVLFFSVLSRPPTEEEISLFLDEGASDDVQTRKAQLADVLWTLLNSGEFLLNH